MTEALYLKNTYLFQSEARIIGQGEDEKGSYILLDKTIFYPQGGGQPSDHGTIQRKDTELDIIHVRQVEDEIRHYTAQPFNKTQDDSLYVLCVDKERRLLNAKYHTAAHLISNVVEEEWPSLKAIKGHSFPKEAYVEFLGEETPKEERLTNILNSVAASDLSTKAFETDSVSFEKEFYKLPYAIPGNKSFRALQIGSYSPVPCGGTHIATIKEIGILTISRIKSKNGTIRISYQIE